MSDKERFTKEYYKCPIEAVLSVIGNKWKGAILYHLLDHPKRYNELRELLPYATQRMLTLQLRGLEKDNIIIRKVYGKKAPLKVEYKLSELGLSIKPLIQEMNLFGKKLLNSKK